MIDKAQLKKHADLFTRMGDAVGVDLQEEAIKGHLAFDEIAEGVLRCTRCGQPEACQAWLARAEGEDSPAQTTPDFCRNADLLAFLKPEGIGS